MNKIKVSACIITYNQEKYIRECLEGALNQKVDFIYEIVIGEDNSSDGTRQTCVEYAEKYPNLIKFYPREKNLGMIGNWTQTIQNCEGKYIALCEGDDYWTDPYKLQKQVDFLEINEGYSGSFHYTQTIQENGELGKMHGYHKDKLDFNAKSTFSKLALFHTSSFVFLKSAFELPTWLSKVISADMAVFSIIASNGTLRCLPEVMSVYRKHSGGITNSSHVINNFHSQRIELMEYLNDFHNYKYQKTANDIIEYHRKAVDHKLEKNELKKSRKLYMDNFINVPFTKGNLDRYYIRTSIFKALMSNLPKFKGKILDIGCGKMPYKDYILKNSSVSEYVGLDIENALIYEANIKPDFTWDGKIMPFKDNSFDCAFGTEVLEHCPEPEIILKEVLRVLQPEGVFFFTVPFLWNLHEVPYDEYRYTPFSLDRHLRNSGFKEIEIKATGGWHASMAQMLGLWVKRSPMSSRKRGFLLIILKPIIKFLIKLDANTKVHFVSGQMITGLYGTAKK